MHLEFTRTLYNQLVAFESKRRRKVYPIHKKLDATNLGSEDIYSWLLEKVGFQPGDHLLDAGCGVGFGCITLARELDVRVSGISISEKEIEVARRHLSRENLKGEVDFRLRSYDQLLGEKFNTIIAVESLKHSPNLEHSLSVLLASLKPGGKLIVVEDMYSGPPDNKEVQQLVHAWGLQKAFQLHDYVAHDPKWSTEVIDLTSAVPYRNRYWIGLRLLIGRVFKTLLASNQLVATFQAGLVLEWLYASGQMQYQVVIYSKAPH